MTIGMMIPELGFLSFLGESKVKIKHPMGVLKLHQTMG
jgi:hypothetical protein